ncbi:MAG TPA: aldehyde dehydrogenase family protein [Pseudomonadales bacterium]|nr:aldehyde dehydrogenase family protein [Pseudomonadales bacterium]
MKIFNNLYCDGKWVASHGQGTTDVINPANGEIVGRIPCGDAADVDRAAKAAKAAFASWSTTPPAQRAQFIAKIADGLEKHQNEMAQLIMSELGCPISLSTAVQVGLPVAVCRSYIELADTMQKQEQIGNSLILREPIGVCGFITPWNYPLHQIVAKVAPALAAGCTVVLKPSQETPLNAFLFAQIIDEAGLPPGVFNLVSGKGAVVGEAIASHPDVDMVSITGSTSAGIRVAELAAKTVKRVSQELGGKSANIILEGADLVDAVSKGVQQIIFNSGQTCSALTRMLVPAKRQAEAVEIIKATLAAVQPGVPEDPATMMGPLVSEGQRETVVNYIRKGIAEGAELVAGGIEKPAGLERGAYVKPTVLANVKNDMVVAQEEIFGPVLCVLPYETEAEAIQIANDSPYGLSGAVWGKTKEDAIRVARQIRTGQLSINGGDFNPLAPFGGYKQSGNGRELGPHAMNEFIELKALNLPA